MNPTNQIAAEAADKVCDFLQTYGDPFLGVTRQSVAAIIKVAIKKATADLEDKLQKERIEAASRAAHASEQEKSVTDPNKCGHDEFLNFACGDYKCSACCEDFEVRCDGDEGRCPVCNSHASEHEKS